MDDEDSLRDFAAKLIEKRGYGGLTAAGGADALAVLKNGASVDLVVRDVMMPGLDGLQTLEQIRKLGLKDLFVILRRLLHRQGAQARPAPQRRRL